jgi:hypothetical protein
LFPGSLKQLLDPGACRAFELPDPAVRLGKLALRRKGLPLVPAEFGGQLRQVLAGLAGRVSIHYLSDRTERPAAG